MTLFEYAVEVTVDIENMKLPYADVHGNLKLIMETSVLCQQISYQTHVTKDPYNIFSDEVGN